MDNKKRTFGHSELAQQYFPQLSQGAAWRKLRAWLQLNPRLRHLLNSRGRTFTPAEVQMIYAEIGEP